MPRILLVAASKSAKAGANSKQMLRKLESELSNIRSEGGKKRRQFNEVMADSGFHKADDFLAAAKQSEQDRQKLADLQARFAESESQRQRLEEQSAELYRLLKDGLARVGPFLLARQPEISDRRHEGESAPVPRTGCQLRQLCSEGRLPEIQGSGA